ncbi:MAG: gas vesicle protein K [Bacteroidota bacterium]
MTSTNPPSAASPKILSEQADLQAFVAELDPVRQGILPPRVALDPDSADQGLAKLVLTLIELLRQLMERQAVRRMDAGSLTDDEVERLGLTLMKLEGRIKELQALFGLEEEELNLSLGPLGRLL